MNLGQISILIAFLASFGAAVHFIMREKKIALPKPNQPQSKWSRNLSVRLYYLVVIAGLVASAALFYALLTHQYKYTYVASYSSNDLPLFYLISSYWAGQEGTFLLWAVVASLMGIVYMRSVKYEDNYAMAVITAFTGFLYLLLVSKSPFETQAVAPPDGSGLNPLLQDPWMVIHPPILFIGYAATVIPFALAVSGLVRRDYKNWFRYGLPWSLFASATLGAGIIIGGFWAYEVLGWGGYWGWDPVENSSLVPWLTGLALVHGLLIFKAKGSLERTNLFLGLITFILVLYATFLTRSGILADFSVHSFTNLGINNYLIASMIVSLVLGPGFLAARFREIKSPKVSVSTLTRENTLLLGMYALLAAAIFTFFGMSSPILTGLVGNASKLDVSFYNRMNLPVAIALAVFLGISPLLGWTEEKKSGILKRFSLSLILTALACVIAYVAGVTSFVLLLFVGAAAFGLVTNLIVTVRQYKSGWLNIGGPLSHVGVALLLIGIVGSGKFDETKQVVLSENVPQDAFGFSFTFKGVTEQNVLKPSVNIEVASGKDTFMANPKLYYSNFSKSLMREPDIKVMPLKDLYISPLELQSAQKMPPHNPMLEIVKGETREILGYKVTFEKFDVGQHGNMAGMSVGAVLSIESGGKKMEVDPLLAFDQKGGRQSIPAALPEPVGYDLKGQKPEITLNALSVEEKKVLLEFHGFPAHTEASGPQSVVVELSIKPLMMVVWTGVVLIIGGTVIAWRRRTLQKNGTSVR